MHANESRVIGLEAVDKQVQSRQKLAYIQRVLNEKNLSKHIHHMDRVNVTENRMRDIYKKQLKDDLFGIGVKTHTIREQRIIVDKFIDKVVDEQQQFYGGFDPALLLADPASSPADHSTAPPQYSISGVGTNVTHSFSEKRLRTILPRLVKRRDHLLDSTLLDESVPAWFKVEIETNTLLPIPKLKDPEANKEKVKAKKRKKTATVAPTTVETSRSIMTAGSFTQGKAVVVVHTPKPVGDEMQPLAVSPVTAVATANVTVGNKSDARNNQPTPGTKQGRDGAKMTTSRGDIGTATARRAGLFDGGADLLEPTEQERENMNRLNMLRMMAGMTSVSQPASNWNRNAAAEKANKELAEAAIFRMRTETPGCPDLRDPLPCVIEKPRLKRKQIQRIERQLPLASRSLLGRFRIQNKKIEETYLQSWKERVLLEDRYSLIDTRRKKDQPKTKGRAILLPAIAAKRTSSTDGDTTASGGDTEMPNTAVDERANQESQEDQDAPQQTPPEQTEAEPEALPGAPAEK